MLRTLLALLLLPTFALAQGPFPQPKTYPPDAATLAKIKAKTEELRKAIDGMKLLKDRALLTYQIQDVEIFHKAAEWIVRHNEWYTAKSAQQTLEVLDAGLKRAEAFKANKRPWVEVRGKPIALGYRSGLDGSIQPFSLRFPTNFNPKKKYPLEVVLHGRDGTLTEVKFLHSKEFAKPSVGPDRFVVEVYGRGNNAYRWAGETDVLDVMDNWALFAVLSIAPDSGIHRDRILLRGFSMGGAGTWHIGLRHPFRFAAISPGAGFTTTHGYISNLPKVLPDYQEKCLRIYDAVNYAENVFNVPVIAYSGEKDKQKAAADNIENALKDFKEPHVFKHLIAPGLEHKQPPEWAKKIDEEFVKHLEQPKPEKRNRVRFVTYTPNYVHDRDFLVGRLQTMYEQAVVDARLVGDELRISTTNIREMTVTPNALVGIHRVVADGQTIADTRGRGFGLGLLKTERSMSLYHEGEKWFWVNSDPDLDHLYKRSGRCGPIDDAFRRPFAIFAPTGKGWHDGVGQFTTGRMEDFQLLWDKFFRGICQTSDLKTAERLNPLSSILFGDPQSNPAIAKYLPKLPIKWTKDELVVNGVKYDPATHVPVLIYPNPSGSGYIVINSGHTFGEADLRGTNALLYPRLGDWAVLKPTPTKLDPAAFEVVAAGLFDEFWQFPKKK